MMRENEMAGRTVVITGGTKGIGLATARAVIAAGGQTLITARNAADGAAATEALGERALFVAQDALREESWQPVLDAARARFGTVDGLVNNVGGSGQLAHAREIAPETCNATCDLNIRGTILGLRHGYAAMRDNRDGGAIVNIASIAALYVQPMAIAYCAGKAVLPALARAAAREFAPAVRVNTIYPGVISSEMAERDFEKKGNKATFLASVPMGRLGEFEEIAALALFLLSPRSRGVNGGDFIADGGKTIL